MNNPCLSAARLDSMSDRELHIEALRRMEFLCEQVDGINHHGNGLAVRIACVALGVSVSATLVGAASLIAWIVSG